ncbi:MAG: GDSL-type esterase/lipase family protein, partial [Gemmataceae bacterium]
LGDSITQAWSGAGKKAWSEHFEPVKAANFGIGGDQTGHVLWRITEGKELNGITPKVAVLMIGTNNISSFKPDQIADGVKAIVKELRQQKPEMKILLLGVFPRSGKRIAPEAKEAKADELQPAVGKINSVISKLDDGKMVVYRDIGKRFLNNDGDLPKDIMYDYLHLTPKGYDIWADAIKDEVKTLLGK